MEPDQNNVALRTVHVVQHAEDFHVHGFRLHALEYREGISVHPGMDLIHRDGRLRGLGVEDD